MQVFNACFKVIRRNFVSMLVYLLIFIFFVVLLTIFYQTPAETLFEPVRPRVAIFNEDTEDPFTASFIAWLEGQTHRVDVADKTESIQDAVFYRYVNYILRIPAGFGQQIMSGHLPQPKLQRTQSPDNWSGIAMDLYIERYIELSALFSRNLDSISASELSISVQNALARETTVQLNAGVQTTINRTAYYFIYLAYAMMAVMILGITTVLLVFNQSDLKRRNLSSPLNLFRFNAQLVFACLLFALSVWLLMFLISLLMGSYQLVLAELLLLALNSLTFTLACLSLSFLLSQFVRSRAVQQSMANVIALGTCFVSGVFVPQELLGDTVQKIASFTPTYWYVLAVNEIDSLSSYALQDIQIILSHILIQLGFAVALLAVSLAAVRQKRQTQA